MLTLATLATAAPPSNDTPTFGTPDETEETAPVVGGRDTTAGIWPGIAVVFIDGEVQCTGTLVAPHVVLTAGHCADGINGVSFDVSDLDGVRPQFAVERVIAYPQWGRTYDVALVLLAHEAPVEPAVIAQDCALEALQPGAAVSVVGYGAVDVWGDEYVDTLQAGTTRILDPECTSEERGCNPEVSPGGELSAGGGGVDACFGDSGGPVFLRTDEGLFLAGVTSRGFDDADLPCSEGGIYVRADAVVDWIEEETGVELGAPSCDAAADALPVITSMSYEVGVCGTSGGPPAAVPWVLAALVLRRRRNWK